MLINKINAFVVKTLRLKYENVSDQLITVYNNKKKHMSASMAIVKI